MKVWLKRSLYAVVGVTFAVSAAAGISGCSHGRGHHAWMMDGETHQFMQDKVVERVSSKLSLDETQQQNLTAVLAAVHSQKTNLMGDSNPKEKFQALFSGSTFDRSGAQALIDSKIQAVTAGSPEVINAMGNFYDSLNVEQQEKVRAFMQHRGRGRHHDKSE